MKIDLDFINKTPVFVVEDADPWWKRIYGATFERRNKRWLFPAFPPFLESVLHDFDKVNITYAFTSDAQKLLDSQVPFEETREYIQNKFSNSGSYDHQLNGLALVHHHYRYGLDWEMGTGKTKVFIDAIRMWGLKVLVLCPLVALDVWVDEARKHSGGTLKTLVLQGSSKKHRLKKFQETDIDILIATYGIARSSGVPTLYPQANDVLGKIFPAPLKTALRQLNDSKEQTRLATDWHKGRKLKEIKEELKELVTGPQWISEVDYDVIIADESHRIKHIKSAQTKAALKLSRKATRRYISSGTMNQGDPREMYPQLKFLAPYILTPNYLKFVDMHVKFSPYNKHIVIGYKNLNVLNRRVTKYVDTKKLDECVSLPERTDVNVYFDLSKKQISDYNSLVKESCLELPGRDDPLILDKAHRVNKLFQICSGFIYTPKTTEVCDTCDQLEHCVQAGIQPGSLHCKQDSAGNETLRYSQNPKLKTLEDLAKDVLEDKTHKMIIWAQMRAELDDVESMLKKHKWKYVRVDGSNTKNIKMFERQFETDKKCRVYLGQIKTGISVTLNAAAYMAYYSRNWLLEDWLQSRFRNYRIGQTQKTVVYRLVARNTVEEQQLSALDLRKDISSTIMEKVNCVMCHKFKECLENNTKPWTKECILDRDVKRSVTKARMLINANSS